MFAALVAAAGCTAGSAPSDSGSARGCDQSVSGTLADDWRSTAVAAGPLWLINAEAADASPDAGDPAAKPKFLKILVVLEPGAEARLDVAAAQNSVAALFYRSEMSSADIKGLGDGRRTQLFKACPDRETQFSGGVIVKGVRVLKLIVTAGERRHDVVLRLG